jgi:hypothetical protein
MNPLTKLTIITSAFAATIAQAGEPRVQNLVLDDHKVYAVPVSGTRVTTISFPSPVAAIDGALVTADGKTPALFNSPTPKAPRTSQSARWRKTRLRIST